MRIQLVDPQEARGRVKEIFDEIEAVRGPGRVSNLLRAYANHLPSLESHWDRMKNLLGSGRLPRRTKEAIGLTMGVLHKCTY